MAVLALFTGELTKAQYDILRNELDWEHKQPAGGVFHAASFDEHGRVHVADVWESPEQLQAFAEKALMPAFQRHGFKPPEVAVFPTHRVIAYAGVDKFRI